MSRYFILAACAVITLGSLSPVKAQTSRREADMQRRHMREYLRFQRHYQQELQKREDTLLEKDETLQFHYSETVISEGIYLEANAAYEKLEAAKLAQLPNAKAVQDAVLTVQKSLRQPGKAPEYYQAQLRNLQVARVNLSTLRESLKEDEEVKLAFDEVDILEKKYLTASRAYEQLMAKAMGKDKMAGDIQKKLAEYSAKIRQATSQPRR
ncbi:MAG: hypothetical protein VCA36_09525 [Opitutales bacterium]